MSNEERISIATGLVNCTLQINDLPLEILNRLSTLLIILDSEDSAEIESAKEEAQRFLNSDVTTLA